MVKVIERSGIPIVQMCNLVPVSSSLGVNKILPTISIPYPLGDPSTPKDIQYRLRYERTKKALEALATEIDEPTVFSV
ncbi:MAG: Betaine reductase complex component B subunit beta [Peptostreptococcus russellii]